MNANEIQRSLQTAMVELERAINKCDMLCDEGMRIEESTFEQFEMFYSYSHAIGAMHQIKLSLKSDELFKNYNIEK